MSPIESYFVRFGPGYKWIATVSVMLAAVVCTAAATMVNVALPDIMGAFSLGDDQVQWLATGFLAAMTATMPVTAWALRNFGYRLSFLGAMIIFSVGTLLGGFSMNSGEVILARILQGMASGLIQAAAMVVLSQVFPPHKRGQAMGIYTIGVILAPALGPTLAGFLIDEYNWRYVFFSIIPICLLAALAAILFLPGRDTAKEKLHFDGVGFTTLALFLTCLLTGLSNGQRYGWNSDFVLFMFMVAAAALLIFSLWEMTCRNPLLDVNVFANGRFVCSCLVAFMLGAGIYGSTYIVPLFVQLVQGYTPTRSGLVLMPAGFALALLSPISGRLSDKLPSWILITAGLLLFGFSCWLCGGIATDLPFWTLAWWIVLGRLGLGLITPALNAGALRALPHEQLAQGSGVLNFTRQLGGAMGVNLLSVVIDRNTAIHGESISQMVTPDGVAGEELRRVTLLLTHWGNPFGERLPASAHPAAMEYLEKTMIPQARLIAYRDCFMVLAIVFFIAIIPAVLIRKKQNDLSRHHMRR